MPRVFEKVYNSAEQKAAAGGRGQVFAAAAATAIDYSKSLDEGGPGLVLRAKHAAFDKLVYGSCGPRWAAAWNGRCPGARRWASGWGTSSAASG